MSQDLFAAFGDPPPQAPVQGSWKVPSGNLDGTQVVSGASTATTQATPTEPATADGDYFDDDDWGDFEDASAAKAPARAAEKVDTKTAVSPARQTPAALPSKPQKENPPSQQDSKIGQHPFAGHMDFLFEPGEDEYDAGEDDLANLAKDPEAAMAFSKRLIAEQEARSKKAANEPVAGSNDYSHSGPLKSQNATVKPEQRRKLTKHSPTPSRAQATPTAPSNPPPARNKLRKKSGYAPAKDPDVLFDAENLSEHDEDDDFGDFEGGTEPVAVVQPTAATTKPPSPVMPSMDLLGLDDNLKPITQIGRSRSDSLRKANEILGPIKKPGHSRNSSLIDDNPWDDFEPQLSAPAPAPAKASAPLVAQSVPDDDAWDDFETVEPAAQAPPTKSSHAHATSISSVSHPRTPSESAVPPTNIPPPATLLSAFPSLFSSATDALFTPLSRLDHSQRQQLLAHPASNQFLRGYLEMAIVLARIIAGRKLRWKRDQMLSQSMRIGQAGMGGKSGMKLTGVDKGEATKEEQEAQEALRMWRTQAGKLRGAVTTASSTSSGSGSKLPAIPEISDQMPVKVLKAVEGGFTAPHACALCGLKREERLAKVDIDVDDSFGEWWVQGMDMHLACRNWWDEHKAKLKSR